LKFDRYVECDHGMASFGICAQHDPPRDHARDQASALVVRDRFRPLAKHEMGCGASYRFGWMTFSKSS
jgi:hypothetical protein